MFPRAVLSFALLFLTGCAFGPASEGPSTYTDATLQGRVFGGQQPIVGAHVYVMQAGTSGYGGASVSLLNSGDGSDSTGNYVLSATDGTFLLTGKYTCTQNTQVYLLAKGGIASGATANNQSMLMAGLGNCPGTDFSTATPFVNVNEVTTVATVYAIAGFMTGPTSVSAPSATSTLAAAGIKNAFANIANIVNLATGTAYTAPVSHAGTVPQLQIYKLADILAACVNSAGGVANDGTTACGTLFGTATSNGTGSGTAPTDTATALMNIAHHPWAGTSLVSLITGTPPFPLSDTTAPHDWVLSVAFTGLTTSDGFPYIDASGNVWFAGFSNIVSLSPQGAARTSSSPPSGGSIPALAIDPSNEVFTVDPPSYTTTGTSWTGGFVSPSPTWAGDEMTIAVDGSGHLWASTFSKDTIGEYVSPKSSSSASNSYTPGGLSGCTYMYGLAIDSSSNIWATCYSGNTVVKISNAGATLSGSSGYAVNLPGAISIDASNNAWVMGPHTNNVTILNSSGIQQFNYVYGSGTGGESISLDGAGTGWATFYSQGVFPITSTFTQPTTTGLYGTAGNSFYGGAIDGSGNIWENEGNAIIQLLGIAAPVVTPVTYNKLAVKP